MYRISLSNLLITVTIIIIKKFSIRDIYLFIYKINVLYRSKYRLKNCEREKRTRERKVRAKSSWVPVPVARREAARSSLPAEKRARFVAARRGRHTAVCIRGIYRVHRIIIKYTVYVSRDWRRRLRSIDPARRERWTKSRWTNGEGRGGEEEEEVTDSGPERTVCM